MKYYAFISYKSDDEAWAKWLQSQLEHFRLPATLCRKYRQLPRRVAPCFRYHTDIQPNVLRDELTEKLAQSRYLIVVCSPRSARSDWVGEEIETFVRLGRGDRIIPLIVDGEPYSGDERTECLHPVMRRHFPRSADPATDREILGVDICEQGSGSARYKRQRAIVKIVARMLGLEVDELWRRYRRGLLRRRLSVAAACCAALLAVACAWHANRPVDLRIVVREAVPVNPALPSPEGAVVALLLDNEMKLDTLRGDTPEVSFRNVPASDLRRPIRVCVSGYGFVPVDTLLGLSRENVLTLRRDPSVFGRVEALLYDAVRNRPMPGELLEVAGRSVRTDRYGRFLLEIPLSEQRPFYLLRSAGLRFEVDTLYMPCDPNSVVLACRP